MVYLVTFHIYVYYNTVAKKYLRRTSDDLQEISDINQVAVE